jgi:hypothetical protein
MVCLVAQSVSEGMFGHWQMSKRFRRVLGLRHRELPIWLIEAVFPRVVGIRRPLG